MLHANGSATITAPTASTTPTGTNSHGHLSGCDFCGGEDGDGVMFVTVGSTGVADAVLLCESHALGDIVPVAVSEPERVSVGDSVTGGVSVAVREPERVSVGVGVAGDVSVAVKEPERV
jgi:hypothetical protein